MTTDVLTPQAEVALNTGIPPKVRRLRDDADRSWAVADGHRTLAAEIESGGEPDAFARAKSQRLLGEVAAHHGFAYHELANAAEARAGAKVHPRDSPQWKLLIDRSFTAIRRAEAHHERAAAFSARTAGDEAAAQRHELAAKEADRRSAESLTGM
ncbi:hypothetical protein [Amycolatopsis speibonae]|uniref:Uncharacterized protein n=1 Tax=Amycolatopsis speibonae TaxID=1450224 RepID=A0ABV7P5P7_9PSEU